MNISSYLASHSAIYTRIFHLPWRIIFFPNFIIFALCRADDACNVVEECNVDIAQRLAALESKVESENSDLQNQLEEVKSENQELKKKNEELSNAVMELEKIVMKPFL